MQIEVLFQQYGEYKVSNWKYILKILYNFHYRISAQLVLQAKQLWITLPTRHMRE